MKTSASPFQGAGNGPVLVLPPHGLKRRLFGLVCLMVVITAPASATESLIGWLSGFGVPHSTSLRLVGESLNIEGTDSAVLEVRSTWTVREIELFYTRQWREVAGPEQIRTDVVAEWSVLSMVTDGLLTVLQLREDGTNRTYGFLSARPFTSEHVASPASPFAGLAFAEQSVASREAGRESRVFTMSHAEPPHAAVVAIRRGLMKRGWYSKANLLQPRNNILVMHRGAEVLDIVALSDPDGMNGSRIVAHYRTDDD